MIHLGLIIEVFAISYRGILQDYYHRNLFNDVPNAQLQLSFVGTLMEVFTHIVGPIVQIMAARYGTKVVIIVGSLFVAVSMELASLSTEIWHLYLTQGVLFGTGVSFLFVTAMGVTPQWFTRRRGFALGLASSGAGIGGLVFPFIINGINNKLGVNWTYRIMGFIALALDFFACIFIKERNPSQNRQVKMTEIVQFKVLRDTNYILWIVAATFSYLGYFIPIFILPSYLTHIGVSPTNASTCITVMSAANFVGRMAVGFLGDRIGRMNASILFNVLTGIFSLVVWMFAYSYGTTMAYAVLFGFFGASYLALMSPITATILGMDLFPSGLSLLLISNGIPVFGPSIASAIDSRVGGQPFLTYKIFTGVVYIAGGFFLIVLKMKMTRKLFSRI